MPHLSNVTCDKFIFDYDALNNRSGLTVSKWSSVVGQLNLVCDRSYLDKLLLQATMIGLFLGGIFGGTLTDFLGRKNTMLICLIVISISLLIPVLSSKIFEFCKKKV